MHLCTNVFITFSDGLKTKQATNGFSQLSQHQVRLENMENSRKKAPQELFFLRNQLDRFSHYMAVLLSLLLSLHESMRQTEELMAQGRPGFENVGELIASMNNGEQ